MHSVIYRTEMLKLCQLELPKHTFYVDNIYVYYPLPHVRTLYYLNVDFYRYFIGREDQSVNEKVMIGHIYHELYDTPDSGEGEHHSGSFFARLMLAVFLFLSFVYIEQNHLKPADISSTQIVNEIQKEIPGNGMDFISRIKLY